MSFAFGFHTDTGRIREQNEDYQGYFDTPNGRLFVLCDGMGGHHGGALAAQLAVKSIGAFFAAPLTNGLPIQWLNDALEKANLAIITESQRQQQTQNMGTTCVVILLQHNKAFYAHVGDSRLYLYRGKYLQRITKDHSYVQLLADLGVLTQKEADYHPRNNEITRALGIQNLIVDVCNEPIELQDEDLLLSCTDGLNGMLTDSEIADHLAVPETLSHKARNLVEAANKAGGDDNTTVQLIGWNWFNIEPNPSSTENVIVPTNRYSIGKIVFYGLLLAGFTISLFLYKNDRRNRLKYAKALPNSQVLPLSKAVVSDSSSIKLAVKTDTSSIVSVLGSTDILFKHIQKIPDSLGSLCKKYNISKDLLRKYNYKLSESLTAGQLVLVPVRAIHTIEAGQIMDSIEKLYYIDRKLIMRANGRSKPKLLVGDTIVIPMGLK